MEKGSKEAKERAKKMREGKKKKDKIIQRIDNLASTIARVTDGFDKRLSKLEQPTPVPQQNPQAPSQPIEATSQPIEGIELLPSKAKEVLQREFPEAKISKVKSHKGGVLIIVDLTDITGGRWVTSMIGGEQKRNHERDYRNIPVEAMSIEKSIKDRVRDIKKNIGLIKEEKVPEKIEREVQPKDLPHKVAGTPEAQFFSTDVK